MGGRSRVADVGVYLPPDVRTTQQTEERLARLNPELRLMPGLIERLTGVRRVHVRPEGSQTSDLAAAAAGPVLDRLRERGGRGPDLLIFASASQDLIEPATGHLVADKLGLDCPVMDVKNACNSVLNGMEVADALLGTGRYRTVLVVSGEQPSHAVRWRLDGPAQFARAVAGYTMSDGGAAVLMDRAQDGGGGVLAARFAARSAHWADCTVPTGGSLDPQASAGTFLDVDAGGLSAAFADAGLDLFHAVLADLALRPEHLDLVAVHQIAVQHHEAVVDMLGVDPARTVLTVADHGNLASVTLPLQLAIASSQGRIGFGSHLALVGLAGGISVGVMVIRL